MTCRGSMPLMPTRGIAPLPRLRRRLRRDGRVRQARLRRGRDGRHPARRPLRARRARARAVPPSRRVRSAASPAATSSSPLGLGAIAYSAQAGAYFAALARIDAGLLSLLVYTFPAIVAVAAAAVGRERAGRRTAAALALSSAGLALVVAGAGAGALDPLGTALGLTAAGVYAAYVLVSERVAQRLGPLAARGARVRRRGGDAHPRRRRRRRAAPGRRHARGARVAGRHRARLDGRRAGAVLRRPPARRPDRGLDPLHRRARDRRGARLRRAG